MDVGSDIKMKKMAYRALTAREKTGQGRGMAVQGNITVREFRQKREVSSVEHNGYTAAGVQILDSRNVP